LDITVITSNKILLACAIAGRVSIKCPSGEYVHVLVTSKFVTISCWYSANWGIKSEPHNSHTYSMTQSVKSQNILIPWLILKLLVLFWCAWNVFSDTAYASTVRPAQSWSVIGSRGLFTTRKTSRGSSIRSSVRLDQSHLLIRMQSWTSATAAAYRLRLE
jgi:hypothetical protein